MVSCSDGSVNVFVNSGNGYVNVTALGTHYNQGEIVLDQCFDTIVGVQVNNKNSDGWTGDFELSTDGKSTYVPLICSDCTGTTITMPITVDLDDNDSSLHTTWCFGGATCTLEVGSSTPTPNPLVRLSYSLFIVLIICVDTWSYV